MHYATSSVPKIFMVRNTGELLNDLSATGRERPWKEKKEAGERLSRLLEIAKKIDEKVIPDNTLYRVKNCAAHVIFNQCPYHSSEKRLIKADFCRFRLCPMCNWRKSLKMFSQLSEISEKMTEDNKELRFIFLTLTVKNCTADKLSETLDSMNYGLKRLTNKTQTLAASKHIKKYLMGYFKALEITYNTENNTYHPHFHLVLAMQENYFKIGFVKTAKWAEIWRKCLGIDYTPIVHLKAADVADKGFICEITKYATKGEYLLDDIPEGQAVEAVSTLAKVLRGRRLVGFSGIFNDVRRQLNQDDIETGDLINLTGEKDGDLCKICGTKMLEHVYTWKLGVYVN